MEGDKMDGTWHEVNNCFSDKFLIFKKKSNNVPNFKCWLSNLNKIADLCKEIF